MNSTLFFMLLLIIVVLSMIHHTLDKISEEIKNNKK